MQDEFQQDYAFYSQGLMLLRSNSFMDEITKKIVNLTSIWCDIGIPQNGKVNIWLCIWPIDLILDSNLKIQISLYKRSYDVSRWQRELKE